MKKKDEEKKSRPVIKRDDLLPRDGNTVKGGTAPKQIFGMPPIGQIVIRRRK